MTNDAMRELKAIRVALQDQSEAMMELAVFVREVLNELRPANSLGIITGEDSTSGASTWQ